MSMGGRLVFIGIFWIAPFFVAYNIGKSKHRRGWIYALLGGWIGVIILACQSRRCRSGAGGEGALGRELELDARLARTRNKDKDRGLTWVRGLCNRRHLIFLIGTGA